jgi:2-(1,2-epoxy-1,2-dihydrophenyl)acetyl-CoA isomerase
MSGDGGGTGADVEVVDDGGVRRITLDRPEKRNAMTMAMFDAVTDAVDGAVADDALRVVVIRGRGDHFCAGAEIGTGERTDGGEPPHRPRTGHLQRNLRASPHRMIRTLFEAEIPIVTGVQGYAAGIAAPWRWRATTSSRRARRSSGCPSWRAASPPTAARRSCCPS